MDAINPPVITKAQALQHLDAEIRRTGAVPGRGAGAALSRLLGITREAVSLWAEDEPIPELQAWRLRSIRPQWFEQAQQ